MIGIEPTTCSLRVSRSAIEPHQQNIDLKIIASFIVTVKYYIIKIYKGELKMERKVPKNKKDKSVTGIMITRARKAHGLTQEMVADILKIKRSTYAYYERNIDPTYEVISQLSTLFNTPVHVLLYGYQDPLEHVGLNDNQTDMWGGEKFGHLTPDERTILTNLRMLPLNLRQKIIREIEDLKEKNEGN